MNTKDQVRSTEEAISTERALDLALEALEKTGNIAGVAHDREQAAITAIKQVRSAPYVASPLVPDALTDQDPETPEYKEGWNDCRAFMLNWRNSQ